ncbi:hypothetical protein ACHAQJ_002796 [Trichoderma viride]
MDRGHYEEAEPDEINTRRSWVSRIKARVKHRSRDQSQAGVASSLTSSVIDRPVLSGLSTVSSLSDTATQAESETAKQTSTTANDNGSPDMLLGSDLWLKAYEFATLDTRKWIGSLPNLNVSAQGSDKGDRPWTEDLVEIVKSIERKHQDKSHRIVIGQKEISLRDYATTAVAWLTMIGDISIQFAPPPSSIIWPAIRALLQLPVAQIEETAAVLGYTEKITGILRRGKVYEVVFTDKNTAPELLQDLESRLIAVYAKALDMLAYAAQHLMNDFLKILDEIVNPGQGKSLLAELIQVETDLAKTAECCEIARSADADESHTKLLLGLHESIGQIDDGVRHLLAELEIREMFEALDYFSDIKFGEQHRKKVEMRTQETGHWLLGHNKFQQWEQADNSSILWLQGTVIDRLLARNAASQSPDSKNNEGFAYFYCERGISDLSEPISVLRSYVRQLSTISRYPNLMQKKLIELYRESRKNSVKLGIQTCKDQLYESANLYPRTILVLDGLDECNREERWQLIEILAELVKHAKNPVKLFISSRREQDIVNRLPFDTVIEIDASDNREDVRKFVEQRIGEIEKMGRWISISQDLKNKVKDTLCAKSDGMFRWAYLQMDQLSKLRQANQIESRLGKLPKTLNTAYAEIFQGIEDGDREALERAVKWIMCAQKPLETNQILRAVQLSVGTGGPALKVDPMIAEETLLDICSHLIIKDSKLDHWKFPHASVIEYFEEVHRWDIECAHSWAAKICLLCLIDGYTAELKVPEAKEDAKTIKASEDDQGNLPNATNSFEFYVRYHWHFHVLALEKLQSYDAEVSKFLQNFLGIDKSSKKSSHQYQRWFQDRYHKPGVVLLRIQGERYFQPVENPIFGICVFGFYNLLKDYWMSGISILQVNQHKMDLLMIAARHGHLHLCEKLIELGSNVNRQLGRFPKSQSALLSAVNGAHINTVKFLLSKGADPNIPSAGPSAICASIHNGIQYTEILLEAKADLNRPCGPRCHHAYPIEHAANGRDIEKVRFLLNHGANVDLYSESGIHGNALTAAACRGSEEMCLLLIDHGADANASLRSGKYGSALAAAAHEGEPDICRLLIDHGADVNALLTCGEYGSALAAAALGGELEICRLLIEYGADVNASLKCGNYGSALAAAAYTGNLTICRLLIENGADIDASLEYGKYGSAIGATAVSVNPRIREMKNLIKEAHADASILSTTSPEIHSEKDTRSVQRMEMNMRIKRTYNIAANSLKETSS